MRSIALTILLLIGLPCALALDFPATIEIDIVFPLNKTYRASELEYFPCVFAVQNAEAAFAFGFSLSWEVASLGNSSESSQSYVNLGRTPHASGETSPPPDATNNVWYWAENITFYHQSPPLGLYKLTWSLSARECKQDGDDVTVILGNTQAGGAHYFTLVADDSGEDVNLESDECPDFGDLMTAEDNADWGEYCPIMGETPKEVKRDPCRARMPAHIAACAMANVTGSDDMSACEKAKQLGDGNGGGSDEDAAGLLSLHAALLLTTTILVTALIVL